MKIQKKLIALFLVVNLCYAIIIWVKSTKYLTVTTYILLVGGFTEILWDGIRPEKSKGYFYGVSVGAKYIMIVVVYLSIRWLTSHFTGIELPM